MKRCAYCRERIWWWQWEHWDKDGVFVWHRRCAYLAPTTKIDYEATAKWAGGDVARGMSIAAAHPEILAPEHRERFRAVYGDAIIENESAQTIVLEGPLLRRLVLAPGARHRLASPIVQPQWDEQGQHFKLLEYDAKDVLTDMIVEHERGLAANDWIPGVDAAPWEISAGMLLQRSKLKAFRVRGMTT